MPNEAATCRKRGSGDETGNQVYQAMIEGEEGRGEQRIRTVRCLTKLLPAGREGGGGAKKGEGFIKL